MITTKTLSDAIYESFPNVGMYGHLWLENIIENSPNMFEKVCQNIDTYVDMAKEVNKRTFLLIQKIQSILESKFTKLNELSQSEQVYIKAQIAKKAEQYALNEIIYHA